MIRFDLQAAGIPYRGESGKVFDFHSLRTSFVTNLIKSGVSVKQAQTFVRLSTPTLTLGTYTQLTSTDLHPGSRRFLDWGRRRRPSPRR